MDHTNEITSDYQSTYEIIIYLSLINHTINIFSIEFELISITTKNYTIWSTANGVRCAVPVGGGGGGRIGLIELPTGATPAARAPPHHPAALHPPALLHPAPLQDWAFDPFRDDRLMVACDDGQVREWIVPDGGGYGYGRGH